MEIPLRIAVFGFESTGKTTLAERLAGHFGAPLVQEYARELWDAKGGLTLEDMLPVAREQWRREDEAVAQCHQSGDIQNLVICDTDALTTMLWSELLYGRCPGEVRRGAEARCRSYALYLLCDIDVPFAPDPQRCFTDPVGRVAGARRWREALEQRGLPHQLIQGDRARREHLAIEAINRLRQS